MSVIQKPPKEERARRLIAFHEATSDPRYLGTGPAYARCLARRLVKLDAQAVNYCAEREKRGHGLLMDQLERFHHAISSKRLACDLKHGKAQTDARERVAPTSCEALPESLRAYRRAIRESGWPTPDAYVLCEEQEIARSGDSIVQLCEGGAISLAGVQFELEQRVRNACTKPEPNPSPGD